MNTESNCDEAQRAFLTLAEKYPKSERADNALYLSAKCLHLSDKHAGAIRILKRITEAYAQGDKMDDSLELMHDSFWSLGQCKPALAFIETLVSDYPRYKHRKRARRKLNKTKRKCGN